MKKIIPFKNAEQAINALDNGGRFYNLFARENDGEITAAEVGKFAGIIANLQQMVLFFDMSVINLSKAEQTAVIDKMSENMRKAYFKNTTTIVAGINEIEKVSVSKNVVVQGIPELIDSKSGLGGFVMVPIMTGKVMTFIMIPITEQYNVYALRNEDSDPPFLIAHTSSKEKLAPENMIIGGVMKELSATEDEENPSKKFMEIFYIVG